MTDLKLPTRMQVSAKPPHLRSPLDMFVLNHTTGVGGDLNWYEWREALLKALTYVAGPGAATEAPGAKNIADDIAATGQMLSDVQLAPASDRGSVAAHLATLSDDLLARLSEMHRHDRLGLGVHIDHEIARRKQPLSPADKDYIKAMADASKPQKDPVAQPEESYREPDLYELLLAYEGMKDAMRKGGHAGLDELMRFTVSEIDKKQGRTPKTEGVTSEWQGQPINEEPKLIGPAPGSLETMVKWFGEKREEREAANTQAAQSPVAEDNSTTWARTFSTGWNEGRDYERAEAAKRLEAQALAEKEKADTALKTPLSAGTSEPLGSYQMGYAHGRASSQNDSYSAGIGDAEKITQEKLKEAYHKGYNTGREHEKLMHTPPPPHEVDNAACILPEWSEATKTPVGERNAVTYFVAEYQGIRTAIQGSIVWAAWRRDLGAALLEAHVLGFRDGSEIHQQEAAAIRSHARDAGHEEGFNAGIKMAEYHQKDRAAVLVIPELTDVRAKDPQTWTKLDMFVAAFGPSFGDARSWRTVLRDLLADYATPSSEVKWLAPGEYGEDGWVIVKRECEWARGPGWQPSLGKILDGSLYDVDGDPWGESHDTALGWLRVEEHKVEAAQVPDQRVPGYYWVHIYNDTGEPDIAQWSEDGWLLIGEAYSVTDIDVEIVSGPITQGDK